MQTKTREENLCESCGLRFTFPECIGGDVEFGDGVGNDNIITCENYWEDV